VAVPDVNYYDQLDFDLTDKFITVRVEKGAAQR